QALGPDGEMLRGLSPTQFILWQGETQVNQYEVIEQNTAGRLAVGFSLSCEKQISDEIHNSAQEAVRACLLLKRADHYWALAKFVSTPNPGSETDAGHRTRPADFLSESSKLDKAAISAPVETESVSATLPALQSL